MVYSVLQCIYLSTKPYLHWLDWAFQRNDVRYHLARLVRQICPNFDTTEIIIVHNKPIKVSILALTLYQAPVVEIALTANTRNR